MSTFNDIDDIDSEVKMTFQALHEPGLRYFHLKRSAVPSLWWMTHFDKG